MKEQIRSNEAMQQLSNVERLTSHPFHPTLGVEGNIFMAEPGNGEGHSINQQQQRPIEKVDSTQMVDKKKLREEWYAAFRPEELENADTRSTIEVAIGLGYGPQKVTSKGPIEFKAKDVISNSLLDDEERIKKAEELLRQSLSPEQQAAVLKAHYSSKGELGKDNRGAGVYNLKREQLSREARILKNEGGFTDEQRRMLLEAGLAATPPGPEEQQERDPFADITDPILGQFRDRARSILDMVRGGAIDREVYQNLYGEIVRSTPSPDARLQQREQFNRQRQLLLEALSGAVRSGLQVDVDIRREIGIKATELAAIVTSGSSEAYDRIDEIIDFENSNDQYYGPFIEATVGRLMRDKENVHAIEYLLEYATERILSRADVSPKEQYPQFGFYENINLDGIIAIARIYDHSIGRPEGTEGTAFKYLSDLRQRRRVMHELFRSMKDRQTYATLVTQSLRKEGLAFVEKEIAGVSEAKMQYDKFSGSALGFKKGWLTSDDHEAIDNEVKDFLLNNRGSFEKDIKNEEREVIGSRLLRPWELKRAAIVGKSLNAAMQRRMVYTVLGDVPLHDIDTLLDSVDSELLARILAPMKLITQRFLGIDTNTRKIFIEELLKKTKELAEANDQSFGYTKTDGTTQGLYNKEEDSWAILDTGITDPQSNGWRGRKIFLKQKDYRTEAIEGGGGLTIMDYLDKIKGEERGKIEERLQKRYPGKNKRQIDNIIDSPDADELSTNFNNRVRDAIQRQRLFLGPLLQMGGLNRENKQMVWEKVAELLPSRIAAFFPEETLDIVRRAYNLPQGEREQALRAWDRLKTKLFLAESKRVIDDSKALKGKTWGDIGQGVLKNLSDYYQDAGIGQPSIGLGEQDPEIRVIEELKKLGKDEAFELARIKFPYTPFLDDVPKTDWENIEDFSYDRILVYDHSDFQEAYGAVIGLMGKPVVEPKTVIEAFVNAKQKMESPLGLKGSGGAQRTLEKYISAYLSMAAEDERAKLIGPLMKLFREPRSKMEEGNLQAGIIFNEDFTSSVLQGLAQQDVISDDPAEKDKKGLTQFMRMKKENKADAKWKLYYWARMILFIFGPVAGAEIIRVMLPREAAETIVAGF